MKETKIDLSAEMQKIRNSYNIINNSSAARNRPQGFGNTVAKVGTQTESFIDNKLEPKESKIRINGVEYTMKFKTVSRESIKGKVTEGGVELFGWTFVGYVDSKKEWGTKKVLVSCLEKDLLFRMLDPRITIVGPEDVSETEEVKTIVKDILETYTKACAASTQNRKMDLFRSTALERLGSMNLDVILSRLKEEKADAERRLTEAQNNIKNAMVCWVDADAQLEAMSKSAEETKKEHLEQQLLLFDEVLKSVESFEWTANGAIILTKPIFIEGKIPMGRYWLTYKYDQTKTTVEERITAEDEGIVREGYCHPHVRSRGEVCLGNVTRLHANLCKRGEIPQLAQLMIGFLESYNDSNPFIRLEHWDKLWRDKLGEAEACKANGEKAKDKRCEGCKAISCKYSPDFQRG